MKNSCKKCGKITETNNDGLCFECWLITGQESYEEEHEKEIKKENDVVNVSDNATSTDKKDKFKINYLVWIIPFAILILVVVIVNIAGLIDFFSGFIKVTKNVGNGNLMLGLCLLPFAIWGGIQIFRGFCEMGDSGKINSAWQMISTILGFVALFISIKNI